MANTAGAAQHTEDLEALFDSIVAASNRGVQARPEGAGCKTADKIINRIGQMTRTLHDALQDLGCDKKFEKMPSTAPDARDRLNYIAALPGKTAERVLNATDAAQPVVEEIEIKSQRLAGEWQRLFDRQLDIEQFKNLAVQTQSFLVEAPNLARITNGYLTEVAMAQDSHELTGQAIRKIVEVSQQLEKQLVDLLVENLPSTVNPEPPPALQQGPVIRAAGRSDVAASQDQIAELLESLGF